VRGDYKLEHDRRRWCHPQTRVGPNMNMSCQNVYFTTKGDGFSRELTNQNIHERNSWRIVICNTIRMEAHMRCATIEETLTCQIVGTAVNLQIISINDGETYR